MASSTPLLNIGSLATRCCKTNQVFMWMTQTWTTIWNLLLHKVWGCKQLNLSASACLSSGFPQYLHCKWERVHWQKKLQPQLFPLSPQTEPMHGLDAAWSIKARLHSGRAGTEPFCHSPVPSTDLKGAAWWLQQLWLHWEGSPRAGVENPHKGLEEP